MKVVGALEAAGIEIIGQNSPSSGFGRGVRLKETAAGARPQRMPSLLFDQGSSPESDGDGK
ncbi:hypothetical protein [Sphingomonas panacis]|uniref:hypothetical protein n=1 Tax=Sphingomonas panacis TaxID=1560345 RepID=UPI0019D0BBF8